MFLVAITGGIATGKSTVGNVFREHGIPVIDADLIAREIVEPGKPAWHKIKEVFGEEVFKDTRELNREALGIIIFNDIELRRALNEITHPIIHRTIMWQVLRHFMSGANYIVMDLPLLFETGLLLDYIHKIITVSCDSETQLKRLQARNELNDEDAKNRVISQMPLEKKCELSHFVIDNNGSIENTQKEALQIMNLMNSSNHHWRIRVYILFGFLVFVVFGLWVKRLYQ